ncbi:MAG: hypothetical protein SNI72_03305, partial [Rikenellaceae bacterium]
TGSEIDSMIISGYTEDGYKADSVGGTLLMFFPVDSVDITPTYDSTLFNSTPSVIAKAETNGTFLAQNLKPIPYYIYAVEDTNNNFIYEAGTDQVGFLDKSYNPAEMPEFGIYYDSLRRYIVAEPQVHFRMFLDEAFKRHQMVGSERPLQHKAMLYFGASSPRIDSIIMDSISSDRILVEYFSERRDTIALWFNAPAEQLGDTLKGRVVHHKHDSVGQLVPVSEKLTLTWRYIETKEEKQEREKQEREQKRAEESGEEWVEPERKNPFTFALNPTKEINPEVGLRFDLTYPVANIDTAAITLQYLSPKAVALRKEMEKENEGQPKLRGVAQPFRLTRDTMNLRRWYIETEWGDVGGEYFLSIAKGAITDIAALSNDSLGYELTMLDPDKYGTLVVNVQPNLDSDSKYILELLNEAGSTLLDRRVGVSSGSVQFRFISPGNVRLRVIEDRNGNGEWDSGNLVERRQSELVKEFQSESGDPLVAMKVNWEIEISIDPRTMFAPESQEQLIERLERQERARLKTIEDAKAKTNSKPQQQSGQQSGSMMGGLGL